REGDGEAVQDVRGDVAAGRGRDPGSGRGRADRVGGVLLYRPVGERGRHPRVRGRSVLPGDRVPGLQGVRGRGAAAATVRVGQRGGVPHLPVDVHDGRGGGLGPARGGAGGTPLCLPVG